MNGDLLFSLGGFFGIHVFLVCLGPEDQDDHGLHLAQQHAEIRGAPVVYLRDRWSNLSVAALRSHNEASRVLVACGGDGDLLSGSGLEAADFGRGVFWLLPEGTTAFGDLPLSLASNLLAYPSQGGGDGGGGGGGGDQVPLREVYAVKSRLREVHFGRWSAESGLVVQVPSKWERRSDLAGVTLVNAVADWPRMVVLGTDNRTTTGLFADVLTLIQASLNFTIQIVQPGDGQWGGRKVGPDGSVTWTGMVRQLQDGEADLCGATMAVTLERSRVIDFSLGLVDNRVSLFVHHNSGGQSRQIDMLAFLSIFSGVAWVGILLLAVLVSLAHCFLSLARLEGKLTKRSAAIFWAEGGYKVLLSLMQRKKKEASSGAGEKVLFLTTGVTSFLLFNLYSADLTATMSSGAKTSPLRSFQDVLDSDYLVHGIKGTGSEDLLKHARPGSTAHAVYQAAYSPMAEKKFVAQQREGPSRAAFWTSEFTIVSERDFLFLRSFQDALASQLAFGLQKDSEFREIFDHHILRLRESGALQLLEKKWLRDSSPDDRSDRIFQEEATQLGYDNLFFPAGVLMVGVLSGIVTSCLERFS